MREVTRSARQVTSARSFTSVSEVVSSAEARTMQTFARRRWRNSSLRKALSADGPR